jgi:hypothetical protein
MSATAPALNISLMVETTVSSGLNARQATPETKHQNVTCPWLAQQQP